MKMDNLLRPKFLSTPNWLVDFLALNSAFALAFLGSYPIYQTAWLAFGVATGIYLAAAIVAVALWRKMPAWSVAATAVGAYLLGGFVLVGPFDSFRPQYLLDRFLGVLTAPVTGWRNILTLQIPLGTYHQVLAPVYLMALATSLAAFLLIWRDKRRWAWAAALPFVPLLFGILFGSSITTSITRSVGPNLTHWTLGTGTALVLLLWLAWRPGAFTALTRTQASGSTGEAVRGRWLVSRVTRWTLGVLMVAAALAGSWWVSPHLTEGRPRDVLRTNIDPSVHIAQEVSPLAAYRQYFSDDLADTELFAFQIEGEVGRLRLATLTEYDGNIYEPNEQPGGTYQRVPSRIPSSLEVTQGADADGARGTNADGARGANGETQAEDEVGAVQITVAEYAGIWVPLASGLTNIDFEGERRQALADGFYYNALEATGIELADEGLTEGDQYSLDAHSNLVQGSSLRAFQSPGDHAQAIQLPESLTEWIKAQEVGTDGASLLTLVDRLRARGYLSHGLLEGEDTKWTAELGNYTFAPSRSGHSLDRIDRMFTRILEQETNAGENPTDELLVSAVGDDEQFAVATALIAEHLGYRTRVVVGFRTAPVPGDEDLTYCEAGSCKGSDLTVWAEVQDGTTGDWGAIDVTPQYAMTPAPRIDRQSDPKYHTVVEPEGANIMPPPQAEPAGSDSQEEIQEEDERGALTDSPIFRWVAVGVLGLFLLLSPFIALLGLKRIKLVRRKRAPRSADRIVGAWQQYADNAVDVGYQLVPSGTRLETAMEWAPTSAAAAALARNADLVTFGPAPQADYDSTPSWNAYQQATSELLVGRSAWQKLRWRLSPRALWSRGPQAGKLSDSSGRLSPRDR